MSCILLRTAFEAGLHIDDSFNEVIYYAVQAVPQTAMGVLGKCLLSVLP